MKIHVAVILLLLGTLLMAERINVAVAANVSYVMDALKQEFYKQFPETEIRVILGSTGKLAAQIQHGAPYDIFMAANMTYPQTLYEKGLGVGKPQIYAKGSLAYFSVHEHNMTQGMSLLTSRSIHTIAIANPKTAPYGAAAIQALRAAHCYEAVKDKLVFGESVSQSVAYVLYAADIGIIATSALYSPKMQRFRQKRYWSEVDRTLYAPIEQGIIVLKRAQHSQAAQDFYAFMLGSRAQHILHQSGYLLP